jgi:hypothetical protein
VVAITPCPSNLDAWGDVAYVTDCYGRLLAVNVADPANPQLLAHAGLPGRPEAAHPVALDGLVAVYLGDESGVIVYDRAPAVRLMLPWVGRRR